MTKPNFIFKVIVLSVFCFANLSAIFAQNDARIQPETSYEVTLQVLVGSNSAGQKNVLSGNLSAVAKNLRSRVPYNNFNLASTSLQRVANTGNLEIKNLSATETGTASAEAPIFSEWTIGQLKTLPDASTTQNSIQITNFRFGQRIPVRSGNGAINYEYVGLGAQKLNLPENVPTVVGSLSAQNPSETAFLVLTVRRAEN